MSSLSLLKKFDARQLFRLFVDGRFQRKEKYNGWIGYDNREPGSVQAMLNGFAHAIDNLHRPEGITSSYIRELHRICMFNVTTTNPKASPGEIRYENSGLPFFKKTTTFENIVEFIQHREDRRAPIFFDAELAKKKQRDLDPQVVFDLLQKKEKLTYRAWMAELSEHDTQAMTGQWGLRAFYQARLAFQLQIIDRMEVILAAYRQQIQAAVSPDAKLHAIASLVRELEILHPFPDGNCRVFACVLLTQLLITYDFPPALLTNPNLDFECSLEQWVQEIKLGMERTQALLTDPEQPVFEYPIHSMPSDQVTLFQSMAHAFVQKLANHQEIFLKPDHLETFTKGHWTVPFVPGLRYSGVSTGSNPRPGTVFFVSSLQDWKDAGRSPREDLSSAISKGVRTLVLDDPALAYGWSVPVLLVQDAMRAFVDVARHNRQAANPLTVLITGTEGKTGSKIQLHHLLSQQTAVHARLDSGNTLIPIHESLASLGPDDKVEINELSVDADEAKTMERSELIQPDMCFFSNISAEHMHVHKTMDGVIAHKSAVVSGLKDDGVCIVNGVMDSRDAFIAAIRARKPQARIMTFGTREQDDARVLSATFDINRLGWNVHADINGTQVAYFLPLFQSHAPVASVGILLAVQWLGFKIEDASRLYQDLQPYESMGALYAIKKSGGSFLFYDQSRRASISGVRSAFSDIANFKVPGKVVALLGSVSSVKHNEWTDQYHEELANLLNQSNVSRLYTSGPNMDIVVRHLQKPGIFVRHMEDHDQLYRRIINDLEPGDLLFIQGYLRLNLFEVAQRIVAYDPAEQLPLTIEDIGIPSDVDTRYRIGLVLQDMNRQPHTPATAAEEGTQFWVQKLLDNGFDYRAYRAYHLHRFFSEIDVAVQNKFGMACVNDWVKRSGYTMLVYSEDFCTRWFNRIDPRPGESIKQMFGSFYTTHRPNFLLHLMAGSTNFHFGLMPFRTVDGKMVLDKMSLEEATALATELNAQLPANAQLAARKWGQGWASIDCGDLMDLRKPQTFSTLYQAADSSLFTQVLSPLLSLLKP